MASGSERLTTLEVSTSVMWPRWRWIGLFVVMMGGAGLGGWLLGSTMWPLAIAALGVSWWANRRLLGEGARIEGRVPFQAYGPPPPADDRVVQYLADVLRQPSWSLGRPVFPRMVLFPWLDRVERAFREVWPSSSPTAW